MVQIDVDQQDYLGVLLGDPSSFGSSAGIQALKATPANRGTGKLGLHFFYVASSLMTLLAVALPDSIVFCLCNLLCWLHHV